MAMQKEKEHLGLYSTLCKKCGHLDPDEPQKYSKCHYSQGNQYCPAEEVQIVVVGKAQKLAQQVLVARAARNVTAESKILAQVSTKSAAFIERFYFYLEQGQDQK